MNRRTTTTAATAASALLLLLLAGCGGHTSDDAAPAAAEPAAATSTPAARPTTPSATPTTEAAVPGHDEVDAQLKQALAAAHAPEMYTLDTRGECVIGYTTWDTGMRYPHFRKDVVAALHAAGWKTGPGGGPGETALTNADEWQVFVDQQDMGKLNGTGSPTRELSVKAYCR